MGESTTDTLPHLCPLPLRGDFLWLVLGKQFCKYFLEKKIPSFHRPFPLSYLFPINSHFNFFSLSSYTVCVFLFLQSPPLVFVLRAREKNSWKNFSLILQAPSFLVLPYSFLLLGKRGIKKREWKKGMVCMLFLFFPPLMLRLVLLDFVFVKDV